MKNLFVGLIILSLLITGCSNLFQRKSYHPVWPLNLDKSGQFIDSHYPEPKNTEPHANLILAVKGFTDGDLSVIEKEGERFYIHHMTKYLPHQYLNAIEERDFGYEPPEGYTVIYKSYLAVNGPINLQFYASEKSKDKLKIFALCPKATYITFTPKNNASYLLTSSQDTENWEINGCEWLLYEVDTKQKNRLIPVKYTEKHNMLSF